MTNKGNSNLAGIGFMVSGMFTLVLMDAVAKWLVEANISPVQVLAIRSWIIVSVILLVLFLRKDLAALKTSRPIAHGVRGALGFAAPLCFFLALKKLPLADATVVFYASTFILTALSALVFKERVGIHRWGAVITGFAGVLIAVNPTGDGELSAYLLLLAFFALCGHYLLTTAFSKAQISAVAPFEYTSLVWASTPSMIYLRVQSL